MIQMLTSVIGQRGVDAMAFLLAFALTALTDYIFRDRLPPGHGRAFAVNGERTRGWWRWRFCPSTQSMWCTMCC